MPQPLVAVVILNWNGKAFLQQFLPALLQTTYPNCRFVVADNASTDDSLSFLRQHFPQVDIIALPQNFGFADGYNRALQQVESDYYLLLNSDVEVTPNWLEPMVQLLEERPEVAACQPKILSYHQKHLFEYAGGAGGWIDAYGYPFARGRVFDVCEEDRGQYNDAQPVFWASGAALLVRSAVFQQLGGFDPFFFAHMEEIDMCWRMQRAGYLVFACPQSVVYHVGGGTLPQGASRKTFLNFRNNLVMLAKNLAPAERWKIPYRMLWDGVAALRALLHGDAGFFQAVLRAHFAFWRWWLGRTRSVKSGKRLPMRNLTGVYPKLLVLSFFVRGKKTFAELLQKKS